MGCHQRRLPWYTLHWRGRHSRYATYLKEKACLPFQVMLPLNLSLFLLAFALSPGNSSYTVCRDTAITVVGVNSFPRPRV